MIGSKINIFLGLLEYGIGSKEGIKIEVTAVEEGK